MNKIPRFQQHAPQIYNTPTPPYAKQTYLETGLTIPTIDWFSPNPNQD
jgi:hypothetical protein